MSIETISLRKFLQLAMSPDREKARLLRSDVRSTIRREWAESGDGGDFHVPFWADAKNHASGILDLRQATLARINAHRGRARLYPLLSAGFLRWWEERRRRRNEPFVVERQHIKGRFLLEGLGAVKVESNLAFSIGDDGYRVVYPYFSESPPLSIEGARLGLWAMSQALPEYRLEDLRILDVLRSVSISTAEVSMTGHEEDEFRREYGELLSRWQEIMDEIDR